MKNILLVLSGIISVLSVAPYLRDIMRHKTKPNLVSWITWTILTGVATSAEIGAQAYRAAFFTGAVTIATGLVVILGLRHGYVKYTQFDVICQISAIVGIILWQVFNDPLIAVLASIVIDIIGALPTIRHSWIEPFEETWQAFAIGFVGGLLGVLAVEHY